ncbi:hypothetical protein IJH29_01810 [Candidatus Saccharibacteria bacterium]|nr:hypothetical protein [Candidatus Saccharibacteria bacterium]
MARENMGANIRRKDVMAVMPELIRAVEAMGADKACCEYERNLRKAKMRLERRLEWNSYALVPGFVKSLVNALTKRRLVRNIAMALAIHSEYPEFAEKKEEDFLYKHLYDH